MQANILLLISYIRHKVLFENPHLYSLSRHQWPKLTCGLSRQLAGIPVVTSTYDSGSLAFITFHLLLYDLRGIELREKC
jgi:hypothetical protein